MTAVDASRKDRPARRTVWPVRRTVRPAGALPVWPVLLVCAAYRLWYLTRPQAIIDGDEAMTGLMVRRILDGHPYAFVADQHYNGAGEQYVQAVFWAVLPQTPFTLRLPEVLLAVLACWLVFLVGSSLLGPRRGWLAAVLYAVGPFFLIWKGVRSHGAYPTAQILGLLAILIAVRLRTARGGQPWLAGAFGLVLGATAWASWTAGYLVVPAAVWAAVAVRRRGSLLAPLAAGAVLGYLPAICWSVRHGKLPLLTGTQPATGPMDRLRLLFGPVLREFTGVGYFDGAPGWPRLAQALALLALAGAYAAGCWRRRHGLLDLVRLRAGEARADEARAADLLLLVPPVVLAFYAFSKFAWWAGEPRYLFAAYPALALGLTALPPRRERLAPLPENPRHLLVPLPAAVAAALVVAVGGTSIGTAIRHSADGDAGRDGCLRTAGRWLADHGVSAAYSDYWTGLPLQLLAGDQHKLAVAPMNSGRGKFPALRYAADAAPPAYVLSHADDPMGQAPDEVAAMDRALASHRVAAVRREVACTTVYTDLRPALRPWELGLGVVLPPGRR
jgi:4-amino-4-deoxy-L-arabinose transferase-like glycosyltransferase